MTLEIHIGSARLQWVPKTLQWPKTEGMVLALCTPTIRVPLRAKHQPLVYRNQKTKQPSATPHNAHYMAMRAEPRASQPVADTVLAIVNF
jgi:hypothetical protein